MLGGPSLARTLVAQKELEENEAVPSERQCKKTSVEAVVGVGSMTSGVEAGAYTWVGVGVEEAACKQEPEVGTALGVRSHKLYTTTPTYMGLAPGRLTPQVPYRGGSN